MERFTLVGTNNNGSERKIDDCEKVDRQCTPVFDVYRRDTAIYMVLKQAYGRFEPGITISATRRAIVLTDTKVQPQE